MPLEVSSQDINGLESRPVPRVTLNGQVSIEGESKHRASEVIVEFQGCYADHGAVGKDGRLTIRGMDPDIYRIYVSAPDLYLKSVQWGTKDLPDGELDLTAGVPAKTGLSSALGADGGEMKGVVHNDKQEPTRAMVVLVPASSSPWAYGWADAEADGRLRVNAIAPGRYKLWAFDNADRLAVVYDPDYLLPFASAAVHVEVQAREKKLQDLKLTVNR
jgi:hypothetical protein